VIVGVGHFLVEESRKEIIYWVAKVGRGICTGSYNRPLLVKCRCRPRLCIVLVRCSRRFAAGGCRRLPGGTPGAGLCRSPTKWRRLCRAARRGRRGRWAPAPRSGWARRALAPPNNTSKVIVIALVLIYRKVNSRSKKFSLALVVSLT
jgi:hypothetical protein